MMAKNRLPATKSPSQVSSSKSVRTSEMVVTNQHAAKIMAEIEDRNLISKILEGCQEVIEKKNPRNMDRSARIVIDLFKACNATVIKQQTVSESTGMEIDDIRSMTDAQIDAIATIVENPDKAIAYAE